MALIELESVSKTFPHAGEAKLLRVHVMEKLRGIKRIPFYALKNVSFRVEHGETLGVVGGNGAGKSTLLSLVCGLCQPNEGLVAVHGRIAPLLELGSGFHPDLTGRENVYLNASLLGLTRQQTNRCFDDIVSFSGIGDFVEEPIRTYSTGMVMRLAFAVAVYVDPDILVIDEVLAVGDQGFQAQCFERILDFKKRGKTLLLVSHIPHLVKQLCDRCIWLAHGQVVAAGATGEVLDAYQAKMTP